jgi:cytochrome c-type biogenesis protein CcmH
MSERTKSILALGVSAIALVVIIAGFAGSGAPASADERVAALAASIRCPFCNGESLAESGASVAADYRRIIADRVDAGLTDDEILREFADNFGDAAILDTSTSRWRLLLWLVPLAALVGGVLVVMSISRSAKASQEVGR